MLDLLTCPPGFTSGMTFESALSSKAEDVMKTATPGVLTLADIMDQGDEIDMEGEPDEEQEQKQEQVNLPQV